jgi:hypothetical protein
MQSTWKQWHESFTRSDSYNRINNKEDKYATQRKKGTVTKINEWQVNGGPEIKENEAVYLIVM